LNSIEKKLNTEIIYYIQKISIIIDNYLKLIYFDIIKLEKYNIILDIL